MGRSPVVRDGEAGGVMMVMLVLMLVPVAIRTMFFSPGLRSSVVCERME